MSGPLEEAVAKVMRGTRIKPSATNSMSSSVSAGRIARIRDRHHTIARMVAAKMPDERICDIMAMTQQSLDLLKINTPAFQELVYHYEQRPPRAEREEEYLDQKHRIARMAQLELHDRLIEEPEKFTPSDLLRIGGDYDDRTGYIKQSLSVSVHAELGDRLEARRRRVVSLAGAGDGGGALSPRLPRDPAPPQLELKAESSRSPQGTEVAPPPCSPPSPSVEEVSRMIMAGRDRRIIPDASRLKRRL